jgi:hypothetical protein
MSTKRPSITVLSDIIQKYVGSDFDKIVNAAGELTAELSEAISNIAVDYAAEGFPQENLDDLLQAFALAITANTLDGDSISGINDAIANLAQSILNLDADLEEFKGSVVSSRAYVGGYDANLNVPNLTTPSFGDVLQGYSYDVTVAGTAFFGLSLNIGDSIRSTVDNPALVTDWVVINSGLTPLAIKTQYESNNNTNEFNDTEKNNLATLTAGATSNADLLHTHAFVSPPATDLQNSYEAGNTIDIADTEGSVTLNQTGQTVPSIILTPNATFPTAGLVGGALHMDIDGTLYSYDPIRSKWLSVETIEYTFKKDGVRTLRSSNSFIPFMIPDTFDNEQSIPLAHEDLTLVAILGYTKSDRTAEFIDFEDGAIRTDIIKNVVNSGNLENGISGAWGYSAGYVVSTTYEYDKLNPGDTPGPGTDAKVLVNFRDIDIDFVQNDSFTIFMTSVEAGDPTIAKPSTNENQVIQDTLIRLILKRRKS